MSTINTTYKINAVLVGPIWWPYGEECWKQVDKTYSRQDLPFATQVSSMEEIINDVENDGDFQSCEAKSFILTIVKEQGAWKKERTFFLRDGMLPETYYDQ